MFEQTFVEGLNKTRKGASVFISFLGQMIVIGIMILVPLLYTDVLPRAQAPEEREAPALVDGGSGDTAAPALSASTSAMMSCTCSCASANASRVFRAAL